MGGWAHGLRLRRQDRGAARAAGRVHGRAGLPGRGRPWDRVPVTAELKAEARRRGLWNLFLTGRAAEAVRKLDGTMLPDPPLTNLQYAPLAEITGRSPALAPEALNCAAPDTGNMELLAEFGSPAQQERW